MTSTTPPYDRDAFFRQHPECLFDLDLRYLLTDLICSPPYRIWAVKELVSELTAAGFQLGERPSKAVSDHLRTEVSRGRVRRQGWGRYGPGSDAGLDAAADPQPGRAPAGVPAPRGVASPG